MTVERAMAENNTNFGRRSLLGSLKGLVTRTAAPIASALLDEPTEDRSRMSRKTFIELAGIGTAAWLLAACGKVSVSPEPTLAFPTKSPEGTKVAPTSAEAGSFGEADIVSLDQIKSTDVRTGQFLDTVYNKLFDGIKGKPEFAGVDFQPFIVQVKDKNNPSANLLFPYFSVQKNGTAQAVIEVDPQTSPDGSLTGVSYNALTPTEISGIGGKKYSALTLNNKPIFSVPYSKDELQAMSNEAKANMTVIFSPYGYDDPTKEANIPALKLASVVTSLTPAPEPTAQPTQKPTDKPKQTVATATDAPKTEPTHDPNIPYVPEDFLVKIAGPLKDAMNKVGPVMQVLGNPKDPDGYLFRFMVYDLWAKPIPILSVSGEQLATSNVTVIACYLTPNGKADWVLLPLYITNNKGQQIGYSETIDPTQIKDSEWAGAAQWEKDHAWKEGYVRYVSTSSDPQKAYENQSAFKNAKKVTGDIVMAYTKGRGASIDSLIKSGDSNNHILIFPITVDSDTSPMATVNLATLTSSPKAK